MKERNNLCNNEGPYLCNKEKINYTLKKDIVCAAMRDIM